MKEYRITKYNPKYRDNKGVYKKDEWTEYSDIGRTFSGSELTMKEYLCLENKYIQAILVAVEMSGSTSLQATMVNKWRDSNEEPTDNTMKEVYQKIRTAATIAMQEISIVCRLVLRNYLWCKLYSSTMFVHFGYDYYMYIGLAESHEGFAQKIQATGLFIEEFVSPYRRRRI